MTTQTEIPKLNWVEKESDPSCYDSRTRWCFNDGSLDDTGYASVKRNGVIYVTLINDEDHYHWCFCNHYSLILGRGFSSKEIAISEAERYYHL